MDITQALPEQEKPQEMPQMKRGRPFSYKEEYNEMLVDHMAHGFSLESFAAKINVNRTTLYDWKERFPGFKDAVARGIDKSLLFWENLGIQGTAGKLKGFNASSYALNMANKHKWTQRQDITTDGEKIEAPIVYIPDEEK